MKTAIGLLLLALLCGCNKIPHEWNSGEVEFYYDKGNLDLAERIVLQNGKGYGDFRYFPFSVNILVHKALRGDVGEIDRAVIAIRQMQLESKDDYYGAYLQFLPHLSRHGLAISYESTSAPECSQDLKMLQSMSETAAQRRFGSADIDATYWYALYVNSLCATPASRAVLLGTLAEIDLSAAKSALRRDSGDAAITEHLCNNRRLYSDYPSSGLASLESSGGFSCPGTDVPGS